MTVTPYLIVRDARGALAFYAAAFGAVEVFRLVDPGDARIGHAEFEIGTTRLMLADEYPDFGAVSPDGIGGSPVKFTVRVTDADAAMARAPAAGATEIRPVKDQFFGDRSGVVQDPFGHAWTLSQTVDELDPTTMQARWDAAMAG